MNWERTMYDILNLPSILSIHRIKANWKTRDLCSFHWSHQGCSEINMTGLSQSMDDNPELSFPTIMHLFKSTTHHHKWSIFSSLQDPIDLRTEGNRPFSASLLYGLGFKQLEFDEYFDQKIIFNDETHFHLDGYINTQKFRWIWATENPTAIPKRLLYPMKTMVWYRPYFKIM